MFGKIYTSEGILMKIGVFSNVNLLDLQNDSLR